MVDFDEILNGMVFKDKSVKDLFKDIYDKIEDDNIQIKTALDNLTSLIAQLGANEENDINPSDVYGFIGPTIKDFLEVSVKNKKNLIELAKTVQQFYSLLYKAKEDGDAAMNDITKQFEEMIQEKNNEFNSILNDENEEITKLNDKLKD